MRKIIIALFIGLLVCTGCTQVATSSTRNYKTFEVSDKALLYKIPPLWYQLDPHYAEIPYGDDTVGKSGCGLCAAATAISYIEQQSITPLELVHKYGSSCVVYGVNDMALFCEKLHTDYNTSNSEQLWTTEQMLPYLEDGALIFASVEGKLLDKEYNGHIVVLWKQGDDYYVIDSMDMTQSIPMTKNVLLQNDFIYFYAIWKD